MMGRSTEAEESKVGFVSSPQDQKLGRDCPRSAAWSGPLSHSHGAVPNSLKGRIKPGQRGSFTLGKLLKRLETLTSFARSRGWIESGTCFIPLTRKRNFRVVRGR